LFILFEKSIHFQYLIISFTIINMNINLPVWDYYKPDFIDPMYVPYQKVQQRIYSPNRDCPFTPETTFDGMNAYDDRGEIVPKDNPQVFQTCDINPFKMQNGMGCSTTECLVRKGWGYSFQRKHSWYPCPMGFTPGEDRWCYTVDPEFEPVLYTDKAFLPKNQYWNSPSDINYRQSNLKETAFQRNSFDFRSTNPYTGNFQQSFKSKCVGGNCGSSSGSTTYQRMPLPDSLIG